MWLYFAALMWVTLSLIVELMPEHFLQTEAWGRVKAAFGWRAEYLSTPRGPALLLARPLPLGVSLAYVPRGPNFHWDDDVALRAALTVLEAAARRHRALALKWEPDWPDTPEARATLRVLGFRPSPHQVQPRRSLTLSLAEPESVILARMKQKTRYNINLAQKKGVSVSLSADVAAFGALMAETGARDGFGTHSAAYYQKVFDEFAPAGQAALMLAHFEGQPLAGVMVLRHGAQAWYVYGASSNRERNRMAPYLAQWEAIRWAKQHGALTYDLWGVPDEDEATLEAQFENRHDGLWGVYRFKRGWGGALTRTVGAWDKPLNAPLYTAYRWWLGRRRTAESA